MWPNPPKTANLVTFTEEILNRKLIFLYSGHFVVRNDADIFFRTKRHWYYCDCWLIRKSSAASIVGVLCAIATHFMSLISFDTPLNLWFSDVFRGYQKRSVTWNGLMRCKNSILKIGPIFSWNLEREKEKMLMVLIKLSILPKI